MKLVIEIPEEDYNNIEPFLNGETIKGGINLFKALEIIKNGKPLPKGHGRLIDADALCDYFWDNRSKLYTHKDLRIVIDNADTIIEADKESTEPHECNTCKFGKNYENGYDATTMNDECGGCCSWNDKWQPKESEDSE